MVIFIPCPLLIKNYLDLKQILELKTNLQKSIEMLIFQNLILTKRSQTKMFNRLYLSNSLPPYPTKSYHCNVFPAIFNNFSKRKSFNRPVFNKVSRLSHSFPMNNAVKNKIKQFPRFILLGPQIPPTLKWHHFFSCATVGIKLNKCVQKHKDTFICKCILQVIFVVTINI